MVREKCYLNGQLKGWLQEAGWLGGKEVVLVGMGGSRPLDSWQKELICEVPEMSKRMAKPWKQQTRAVAWGAGEGCLWSRAAGSRYTASEVLGPTHSLTLSKLPILCCLSPSGKRVRRRNTVTALQDRYGAEKSLLDKNTWNSPGTQSAAYRYLVDKRRWVYWANRGAGGGYIAILGLYPKNSGRPWRRYAGEWQDPNGWKNKCLRLRQRGIEHKTGDYPTTLIFLSATNCWGKEPSSIK